MRRPGTGPGLRPGRRPRGILRGPTQVGVPASTLTGAGSYLLAYVSRRLRIFGRPKHLFGQRPTQTLVWKPRVSLRNRARKPLWRFFRPKHVGIFAPPPAMKGAGSYLLPFIARRLRIFGRPKKYPLPFDIQCGTVVDLHWNPTTLVVTVDLGTTLTQPFVAGSVVSLNNMPPSWSPSGTATNFNATVVDSSAFNLFTQFKYCCVSSAPSTYTGGATWCLVWTPLPATLSKPRPRFRFRRLRIFGRPKKPFAVPTKVQLLWKPRISLRYRARKPLSKFFRPKHLFGQQPTQTLVWKRPVNRLRARKPLWRFFRPKHLFGQRPTQTLVWKRPVNRLRARKPLWKFFRPKHLFGQRPTQTLVWKSRLSLRNRARKPLWRFYRPKHLFVLRSQLLWKRPLSLRYRARKPLWRFFRPKHLFGQIPTQTLVSKRPALRFRQRKPFWRFRLKHLGIFALRPPALKGIRLRYRARKSLWRFFRPKHVFGLGSAPQPSNLSRKRPVLRYRARKPLWRFFRPKHVLGLFPPPPPAGMTGAGFYPLLRFPRVSWIVNVARSAVLPLVFVLQKPRPTIRFKQKRPLWRFFRPRHVLGYTPQITPPPSTTGAGTYALPFISRRLRVFGRPKHVFGLGTPVKPAGFVPRRYVLRYRARKPLWKFFRPKHLRVQTQPAALVWKRPVLRNRPRKPLWRLFRPKHLQVQGQPPALVWKRPVNRLRARKPLWRFFRPKHLFGQRPTQTLVWKRPLSLRNRARKALWKLFRPKHLLVTAAPLPPVRQSRVPLRYRARKPLWKFFRPRHLLQPQAQPASSFPRKPPLRPRIKRARINVLRFKKDMYAFSTPPTPPPSGVADWLVRYRRRGRR